MELSSCEMDKEKKKGEIMTVAPMTQEPSILARLLKPLEKYITPELAQRIAELRATPEAQARLDELADKCNEGELTPEETAEYDSYVDAIDLIAVLQAQARDILKAHGKA
jgi:hypothetical protein